MWFLHPDLDPEPPFIHFFYLVLPCVHLWFIFDFFGFEFKIFKKKQGQRSLLGRQASILFIYLIVSLILWEFNFYPIWFRVVGLFSTTFYPWLSEPIRKFIPPNKYSSV